jgi:uncharacterized damage-inducible protein DinB
MKAYFIQQFNYDRFANGLILEIILSTGAPEKPVKLMAHLLAAQQIWLSRCKGEPAIGGALWPDWPAAVFEQIINDNHREWLSYLNTLNPDDFDRLIAYKSFQGMPFENKLVDILAHLINHGTHHRAQAGQQLKLAGVEKLPITDYIFYLRN